ncbi:hypothetical protein [Gordonia sp. (in: high G+C Gram-positive bacteria)]|uniref:hypothetical protein n=1 Tax=Gordonia sp. (in: high G+C Gram-positive bacteria) TaxID=84139 RepID=UPI003F952F87
MDLRRVIRAIVSRAPKARLLVTSYTNYADVMRSNAAQPILNARDFSGAFHSTAAGERAFARILADQVRAGA